MEIEFTNAVEIEFTNAMEIEFTNAVVIDTLHKIGFYSEKVAPGQEKYFAKNMKIKGTEQTVEDRSQKVIKDHFIQKSKKLGLPDCVSCKRCP